MQPLDFRDLALAKAHVFIASFFVTMCALLAAQIVAVLVADHQQLHAFGARLKHILFPRNEPFCFIAVVVSRPDARKVEFRCKKPVPCILAKGDREGNDAVVARALPGDAAVGFLERRCKLDCMPPGVIWRDCHLND